MADQSGNPRIMVVGSSNTDMVIKTDRLPSAGETVLGGEFVMVPGGKGANQAVAAAKLGAQVSLVARLGTDVFGDASLANFRREGIDTGFVARDPEHPSGVALIFVDRHGENVIVVAPGANARLSPEDVERAAERMSACSAVVLQLEVPMGTVEYAARLAHGKGIKVILNPAPMRDAGLPGGLLGLVDVLVPNESEARVLLGLDAGAEMDADAVLGLLGLGAASAVVTLGRRGALVVSPDGVESIPALEVKATDTTAAGDAFTGALAVALSSGHDLVQAARFAGVAAGISVTRMGAQPSLPTAEEVAQYRSA